ncbi:hypothetical protein Nepgr_027152 [Nepenthes gracilis]|uniref:C-CAP/cofactor C-like domain-containing protein n=1 Tax=Nepenthes gracilis TaxID=150966 RepID=A0AAD3TAB6_NEPGR|nr:hypothetical protein Nepgr_027152 [Nepenthes gracilis]
MEDDRDGPSIPNSTRDPTTHRRHQAMLERLSKPNQSQPPNRDSNSSPSFESTDSFLSRFADLKLSITSRLSLIQQSPESFSKSDLDNASAAISDLDKLLAENSYYLPPYEVRASLKTISGLKESLENLSSQLFPRKKFAFKNKPIKRNPANCVPKSEIENPNLNSSDKFGDLIRRDLPGFSKRDGEVLMKDFKGEDIRDFTVSDLRSCDVKLKGRSSAIFVHRLRNCKVYAGPVLGSVLIEDVEDCIFVLASHQIRVHNAKKCDFYLRVRSRPVIEDCSEVRFAPYCLHYDGIEEELNESMLDEETGNWAKIDDFKWLRAVQSPNWSVIPENDRMRTIYLSNSDS